MVERRGRSREALRADWRHEHDENGSDTHDELAFQTQLKDYARELHDEHRVLADAWNPDNAPDFNAAGATSQ
jgi:hypothetical protein